MVTSETIVSTGADYAKEVGDGWILVTENHRFVAQYEHSLIVTGSEHIILTQAFSNTRVPRTVLPPLAKDPRVKEAYLGQG